MRLKQEYLDPAVVQGWRDEFDPIALFEARGLVPDAARIRASVEVEVEEAIAFARSSEFPPASDAYRDVFYEEAPA